MAARDINTDTDKLVRLSEVKISTWRLNMPTPFGQYCDSILNEAIIMSTRISKGKTQDYLSFNIK
jgi:hypothetical protein